VEVLCTALILDPILTETLCPLDVVVNGIPPPPTVAPTEAAATAAVVVVVGELASLEAVGEEILGESLFEILSSPSKPGSVVAAFPVSFGGLGSFDS
jgi:hypothetical protein